MTDYCIDEQEFNNLGERVACAHLLLHMINDLKMWKLENTQVNELIAIMTDLEKSLSGEIRTQIINSSKIDGD